MRRLLIALMLVSLGVARAVVTPAFPASGAISNPAITEGQMKALLENWVSACIHLSGGPYGAMLTVAGGSITPNRSFHTVWPQGGAGTDDLTAIAGDSCAIGFIVLLRTVDSAHDIVIKDGATVQLAGDSEFELEYSDSWIMLIRTATTPATWAELGRDYGAGGGAAIWRTATLAHFGALASAAGTFTTSLTGPMIRLTSTTAVTLTSTAHALQIGPTGGLNTRMSPSYLQALNNGATTDLRLNPLGGNVLAGTGLGGTVWHSANDGTLSTLDADLLDGLHSTSYLNPPYVRIWYDIAVGSAGQTSATIWTKMYLTDTYPAVMSNGIASSSLASSVITLPAGTYRVDGTCLAYRCGATRFQLIETTSTPDVVLGTSQSTCAPDTSPYPMACARIVCTFTLAGASAIELQGIAGTASSSGWGRATNLGTQDEVYQTIQIWKLN